MPPKQLQGLLLGSPLWAWHSLTGLFRACRYAAIRHLPLAKDLVRASRQQLVAHLDAYSKRHPKLFRAVCRHPGGHITAFDKSPLIRAYYQSASTQPQTSRCLELPGHALPCTAKQVLPAANRTCNAGADVPPCLMQIMN